MYEDITTYRKEWKESQGRSREGRWLKGEKKEEDQKKLESGFNDRYKH
jgi:hypothetical protein